MVRALRVFSERSTFSRSHDTHPSSRIAVVDGAMGNVQIASNEYASAPRLDETRKPHTTAALAEPDLPWLTR